MSKRKPVADKLPMVRIARMYNDGQGNIRLRHDDLTIQQVLDISFMVHQGWALLPASRLKELQQLFAAIPDEA